MVEPGMRLGLGSGRMALALVEALRPRVVAGLSVQGLCTSPATEALARSVGIELLPNSLGGLDLDLDGADEFDAGLNLLKGGGGALLREKVVAQGSRRFWVLADSTKEVGQLASKHPLPVEVLTYDWQATAALCEARLSCRAELRGGLTEPATTDNGNYLLDLHFAKGLTDSDGAAQELSQIAGVLGHGLFLKMATAAIIFDSGEVRIIGDLDRRQRAGVDSG